MNLNEIRLKEYNRIVLRLMSKLEIISGLMFHEYNSQLETTIFQTLDSKDCTKIKQLILQLKRLEYEETL